MNGNEVRWLEKLFEQHKKDQQTYLDNKFKTIEDKLDERQIQCENWRGTCRECIETQIDKIAEKFTQNKKETNKKIIIGSVVAIIVSITLWALFGTDALAIVIGAFSRIPDVGM